MFWPFPFNTISSNGFINTGEWIRQVSCEFVRKIIIFSIANKESNNEGSNGHAGHEDGEETDDEESELIAMPVRADGQGAVLAEDAGSTPSS